MFNGVVATHLLLLCSVGVGDAIAEDEEASGASRPDSDMSIRYSLEIR